MSSCSLHPSKESIGACVNCGKLTCSMCHVELGGKSYCQPCADKLFSVKPAAITETKSATIEPAKSVQLDMTKSIDTELEEKDKTIIVTAPSTKVTAVDKKPKEMTGKVGWIWWVPPIILGWIGGLLSWLANKESEPNTARNMLFSGIGVSVLQGVLAVILVFALCVPAAINQGQNPPTSSTDKTQSGVSTTKQMPKLITLSSQSVQPSDKDQTVSYEDKLQVTVPGGELKEAQKLMISSVTDIPDPISNEKRLFVYDISFEKQHIFRKDLTFSFAYDAALLPTGSDPSNVLKVSSLDEENDIWVYVTASIDSAHNMISVQTPHNGCWQVSIQIGTQQILLTDHLAIYYDHTDFNQAKLLKKWEYMDKAVAGTITDAERAEEFSLRSDSAVKMWEQYSGQIVGDDTKYYAEYPDAPRYIVDIAYYAENAWEAYFKATGKQPIMSTISVPQLNRNSPEADPSVSVDADTPWEVLVSSHQDINYIAVQRLPIYVYKSHTKDPMYKSDSKAIYMGFNLMYINLPELTSHEVFHAVQNMDYYMLLTNNLITMATDWTGVSEFNAEYYWWLESTAEYVAYKVAFPVKRPFHHKLDLAYLAQDFFSPDEPNRIHTYKNAWLLDYLVNQQHVNFAEMYNNVAAGDLLPKYELDTFIKMNVANSLNDAYRLFADYLFFDAQSPIKWDQITAKNTTLAAGQPQVITFIMPAGLTADQKGMVVPAGAETRTICVKDLKVQQSSSWLKDSPYLSLDTYRLKGNQRDGTDLINSWDLSAKENPDYTEEIELSAGDGLYFVVTCYSSSAGTELQFTLEDKYNPALSIIPPPEVPSGTKGTTCTQYEFQGKATDMPKGASYTWYINDAEISSGTVTSMKHAFNPGAYRIKLIAKWGEGGSAGQKEANLAFYIGNPKLTVKGPKELKEGEKGIKGETYTFWVEPEYVPNSAKYIWDGGATGSESHLLVPSTGPVIAKVVANWDINDCKDSVEGSTSLEIGEPVIDSIEASPAMATPGQSVTFTARGYYMPKGAVFGWDFGDSGGMSTLKLETPVTHKYDAVNKYNVTMRAYDKQGGTWASKQIIYEVKAAALPARVTIVQPTDIAAGKGVTGVQYIFVANTENVPKGALYTWYLNGQGVTQGIDDPQAIAGPDFFKAGAYSMSVVVTWQDPVLGKQTASDTISYQIKSGTTPTPPAGNPTLSITPSSEPGGLIVDHEYTFTAAMSNATPTGYYSWDIEQGNPTTALNASAVKCKFATPGTFTISLRATGKTSQGNRDLTAQLDVTVYGNTEISKEEVQFIVYRWVTTKWSDGSTSKARQYCQQFHIQILRDNIVIDSGDSIARNGAFEIILPTGHYTYKVGGKYLNPDGVCSGTSGFDVVKGARNIFEIEDSPLTKSP